MNTLTPEDNMDRLRNFFQNNRGLVFCRPATSLIHLYPWIKDAIGLVHPIEKDATDTLITIDWSISKKWHTEISVKMQAIKPTFALREIELLDFRDDIPQLVDDLADWGWHEITKDDVVCIVGQRIMAEKNVDPVWHKYRKHYGIVQRVEDKQISVMFKLGNSENVVRQTPKEWLVRLPPSFKKYVENNDQPKYQSTSYTPAHHNSYTHTRAHEVKPKYKVGDVVRTTSSAAPDRYIGLIGVIQQVHKRGVGYYPSYYYDVRLDTLPNNSLMLCEGEKETIEAVKEFSETSLTDDYSPIVTEKPFLVSYRLINKRMKLWCASKRKIVEVAISKSPKKVSQDEGIIQEASGDDDTEPFFVSCRDLDYLYDKEKLIKALGSCRLLMIAVEDGRTDDEKKHPRVYIYGFDDNELQHVKYRIYLGQLTSRPSLLKRFDKMFNEGSFTNPWQLRRYLLKKTIGYFYEITDAQTDLENIPEFEEWLG